MAVIAILSLTSSEDVATFIPKLEEFLKASNARFVIGTKVQDPQSIQITTEWPSIDSTTALESSSPYKSLLSSLNSANYTLDTVLATLDKSPLDPEAAPLIEYVKTDFPSTVDQKEIEDDFARFESIYRKRGTMQEVGEVQMVLGWTEAYAEKGKGDKVKSLVVARGWREMKYFEQAVGSEEFREGMPILMGWGMPFNLWHVDTKVVG